MFSWNRNIYFDRRKSRVSKKNTNDDSYFFLFCILQTIGRNLYGNSLLTEESQSVYSWLVNPKEEKKISIKIKIDLKSLLPLEISEKDTLRILGCSLSDVAFFPPCSKSRLLRILIHLWNKHVMLARLLRTFVYNEEKNLKRFDEKIIYKYLYCLYVLRIIRVFALPLFWKIKIYSSKYMKTQRKILHHENKINYILYPKVINPLMRKKNKLNSLTVFKSIYEEIIKKRYIIIKKRMIIMIKYHIWISKNLRIHRRHRKVKDQTY